MATAQKKHNMRLDLSHEAYATAEAEAREAGLKCVGTKVRIDMERYYANVRHRRQKRLERGGAR